MNDFDIPEYKTLNWKPDGDSIIIDMGYDKFLLNASCKVVWEQIDGVKTLGEIKETIYRQYSAENSIEDLQAIIADSFSLFWDNDLIAVRPTSDFDGWLQYE